MKSLFILLTFAFLAACSTETNSSYPNRYHFADPHDPFVEAAGLFAAGEMGIGQPQPKVISAQSKRLEDGRIYRLILRNSEGRRWEAIVHSLSSTGYRLASSRIVAKH